MTQIHGCQLKIIMLTQFYNSASLFIIDFSVKTMKLISLLSSC